MEGVRVDGPVLVFKKLVAHRLLIKHEYYKSVANLGLFLFCVDS